MQYAEVSLEPGQELIAEPGGMLYMESGITMNTIFGDGSGQGGGGLLKGIVGAGKRLLTGESIFTTVFGNNAARAQKVAFAAPYPGKIIPISLTEIGGELIAQKDSFLFGSRGTELGIAFNRRLGAGLFGGEGFILQRLRGSGVAFVHASGSLMEHVLPPGEVLRVDTGCLVAMVPSVTYDIERVRGVKSMLFGGEGLFFATLRGPGRVWLQSLPFSRLADRIMGAARGGREEGSVLGGLGRILDGDN
jgi:uncharacterized protein (TIGR00266 family)